jgi:outer membrane protein assembly factor BamB
MVLAVSGNGTVSALSMDGLSLWQLKGPDLPIAAPYEGRDGRIFIVYANRIVCVSPTATVKWTLSLTRVPRALIAETGSGDLLLALEESRLLRVSPYGQALELIELQDTPTALLPVDSGFVCGFSSGTIRGYDVRDSRAQAKRNATEPVWERKMGSQIVALASQEGTLCALDADGGICGLNVTDGAPLWAAATGLRVQGRGTIEYEYGQFNLIYRGYASARTALGRPVFELGLPVGSSDPALSDDGYAFTTDADGTTVHAFRAESRVWPEKKAHKGENYGILKGSSAEYGTPLAQDRSLVSDFLAQASRDIMGGTVGTDEVSYARRLAEIVRNDKSPSALSRDFDPTERARAASLLGRLCSTEYRGELLDAARNERDPTVLVGVLYGISALGPDLDGAALDAVATIDATCGIAASPVIRASCDALYAIVRYSGGAVALKGSVMLAQFAQSPYGNLDREFARMILGKILQ